MNEARNKSIHKRLNDAAAEIREIVKETGCRISLAADLCNNQENYEGVRVHSTIFAGEYRMDHFNSGDERTFYKGRDIRPEEFALGEK